jgi:hypothetical protein
LEGEIFETPSLATKPIFADEAGVGVVDDI